MTVSVGVIRIWNANSNGIISSTTPITSTFFRPVDSQYFSAFISSTTSGTISMYASLDNINYTQVAMNATSTSIVVGSGTVSSITLQPVLAPYYYFVFSPAIATGSLMFYVAAV